MGASPSPMGISPHLGLRYFAAKRQASGLDSYGMPVALLQKQVKRPASWTLSTHLLPLISTIDDHGKPKHPLPATASREVQRGH